MAKRELRNVRKARKGKKSDINRRRTQTGSPSGQRRKIIRQDLQDCAGSFFLPESADKKHVNPVRHSLHRVCGKKMVANECGVRTAMKNSKARILVVEDDAALLQGLMDVLVFNGYEVHGSADGSEGLRAALEAPCDLVLLDVMLPGLDGLSVCREIRQRKPNQAVVMITAKGAEEEIVAGFKAGADDYIPKPFSLRELMVRVEAVLRRAGKNTGEQQVVLGDIRFDGHHLVAECRGRAVEITRREMDIVAYLHRIPPEAPARTVMTAGVQACDGNDVLVNALRRMIFADISRLFVYRESPRDIVGVFSLSDATRFRSGTCRACVSSRIRPH